MKEKIIEKLKEKKESLNMGKTLNYLQDVALKVLSPRKAHEYISKSSNDARQCDGMDGLFINGRYFDWKVFETQKYDIVKAYLDYFDNDTLVAICERV